MHKVLVDTERFPHKILNFLLDLLILINVEKHGDYSSSSIHVKDQETYTRAPIRRTITTIIMSGLVHGFRGYIKHVSKRHPRQPIVSIRNMSWSHQYTLQFHLSGPICVDRIYNWSLSFSVAPLHSLSDGTIMYAIKYELHKMENSGLETKL